MPAKSTTRYHRDASSDSDTLQSNRARQERKRQRKDDSYPDERSKRQRHRKEESDDDEQILRRSKRLGIEKAKQTKHKRYTRNPPGGGKPTPGYAYEIAESESSNIDGTQVPEALGEDGFGDSPLTSVPSNEASPAEPSSPKSEDQQSTTSRWSGWESHPEPETPTPKGKGNKDRGSSQASADTEEAVNDILDKAYRRKKPSSEGEFGIHVPWRKLRNCYLSHPSSCYRPLHREAFHRF